MNETIGSRISKYRKAKGLTQEKLAEIMGVSSQAVSKWENDLSCPDISLLPRLAKTLDVTTDAILSGKQEEVMVLPPEQRKSMDELILRILVLSHDGDRVKANLPMSLVQMGLEIGMDFTGSVGGMEAVKNVDWNKLLELVRRGLIGKLVEIETGDGDTVEIYVE